MRFTAVKSLVVHTAGIFMYVPCILFVFFFILTNNAQYTLFLTIYILLYLLHVSIHLYCPQRVSPLYFGKVM